MPDAWITCGEALRLARHYHGDGSAFADSHPAHIAIFRQARDGELSLKAESILANFDGIEYAAGKAMSKGLMPLPERDCDVILRKTSEIIYNKIINNNCELQSSKIQIIYFSMIPSIFEIYYNNEFDFYESWILKGIMFKKYEIDYLFCDDPEERKRLISNKPGIGKKGIVPYSNDERIDWIKKAPELNTDVAYRRYRQDPRCDGTKQKAWRAEWREIRGRPRGRPPKIVK
jgi:hypothetical protein